MSLTTHPYPTIHTVDVAGTRSEIRQLLDSLLARLRRTPQVENIRHDDAQQSWVCTLADGGRGHLTVGAPAEPGAVAPGTHRITASYANGTSAGAERFFEEVRHLPFTDTEMAAVGDELPLTSALSDRWNGRPLSGVGVILTIHHMRDFLVLVESLLALGVDPANMTVIDKEYPYAHSHRVDAHLVHRYGIEVWRYRDLLAGIKSHVVKAEAAGLSSIVMDDGGYVMPAVLTHMPSLAGHFTGLVEQTTSGIRKLDGLDLPIPLFSVAESDMKGTIESYGIADAAVRNTLRLLPDEKFEGQAALVLGFGRIGSEVAGVLRDRRMRVAVYDADITRLVGAHEQGYVTGRSLNRLVASHQPKLVIGCVGATSFGLEQARLLPPRSFLVSTTSRDYEFALAELRAGSSAVAERGVLGTGYTLADGPDVLAVGHGMPINFHYAESLSNRYVDLVLAGLAVGAVALAQGDERLKPGHNVAATNAILSESGIIDAYYQLYGPTSTPPAGDGRE
ncbi:hypothetical protein AB0C52_24630 [Streptomyces sp. NPDC048717]|uniref:hypothetical protein n=1 Tax=Streptomyces sp. NPDC048717 TaxID=3154928 RepID=UPI003417C91A